MDGTEQESSPQEVDAHGGDAVERYCRASAANDLEGLLATLSADAELISPLSGHMVFRGRADLRTLLGAIYGTLKDLRWGQQMRNGARRAVIAESRVAGLRLDDAMVFELDDDGLIRRVRPHLRPWLSTTVFALVLGPRIAPHPGLVLRALRARPRPRD